MAQMGQGNQAGYYENGVADPWTGYPVKDIKLPDSDGFCGHGLMPDKEVAISKLCNQF